MHYGLRIFVLSDNSGYYSVISNTVSSLTNICKLIFTSPSSAQCYEFPFFSGLAMNKLRLSESQFFFIGIDPSTFSVYMVKLNYGSTSPVWMSTITCPSTSCSLTGGESLYVSSSNLIYSVFVYECNFKYLILKYLKYI